MEIKFQTSQSAAWYNAIGLLQAVSQWAEANPEAVQTGSLPVDSVLQILLSTGMFVAGMTGFILDNTISGRDKYLKQKCR